MGAVFSTSVHAKTSTTMLSACRTIAGMKTAGGLLAETVRRMMAERGWTQTDLANRSGLAQRTVSYVLSYGITHTRHPTVETIELLSKGFGVPPAALFSQPKGEGSSRADQERIDALEDEVRALNETVLALITGITEILPTAADVMEAALQEAPDHPKARRDLRAAAVAVLSDARKAPSRRHGNR